MTITIDLFSFGLGFIIGPLFVCFVIWINNP